MEYFIQFAYILGFSFGGEVLHALVPLPIPAAIYGLALLLAALLVGWVKPQQVRRVSNWLISIMTVMFVAPAVSIMEYWPLVAAQIVPILAVIAVSTVLTFAVSGRVTEAFSAHGGEKTDG